MKASFRLLTVFSLFALLFISACSKDDTPEDSIDAELVEYLERFREEGALRGVTVDYDAIGLEAHIVEIPDSGVRGQCVTYTDGSKEVRIDNYWWSKYADLEKEFLVFHELGHCVLNRGHTDEADENGYCISIMHSSNQACFHNYFNHTREEYLDELFAN